MPVCSLHVFHITYKIINRILSWNPIRIINDLIKVDFKHRSTRLSTYAMAWFFVASVRMVVNCTEATSINRSRRVRSIIQRYNRQLICLIPPCAERAPSEARHNRSSIAITGLWLIRRSPREGRFPGAARERGLVSGDIRGLRRGNRGRELCAELDRARRGPASTFIRLR